MAICVRNFNANQFNGSADKNRDKLRRYDENYLFWVSHVFLLLEKNNFSVLFDIKSSLSLRSLPNDILQHVLQMQLTYFGTFQLKKKLNEAT